MVEKNKVYINTVSGFGADGEGVVKENNFPVFIPFALKGEQIEYKVIKDVPYIELLTTPQAL